MAASEPCLMMRLPPEIQLQIGELIEDADAITMVSKAWRKAFLARQFRRVCFAGSQQKLAIQLKEFLGAKGDQSKDGLHQSVKAATIEVWDGSWPDFTSGWGYSAPDESVHLQFPLHDGLGYLVAWALMRMTSLKILCLKVDKLEYFQVNDFRDIISKSNAFSRIRQLSVTAPTVHTNNGSALATIKRCGRNKLQALEFNGWLDSLEYLRAKKHQGLERLHLHYDKPYEDTDPACAALTNNATEIFKDFKHLKWLILTESDARVADGTAIYAADYDRIESKLSRLIKVLQTYPTLERFAFTLYHRRFSSSFICLGWTRSQNSLQPQEIAKWYEELIRRIMREVSTLKELWIMDEYPPLDARICLYSGTRASDGSTVTFKRHSIPGRFPANLLD